MKRMDYMDVDTANCSRRPRRRAGGQPWVVLILREVVWGVRRFSDMQAHMGVSQIRPQRSARSPGRARRARAPRLPGARAAQRFEYHLTPEGRRPLSGADGAAPVGDKYLAGPEGPASLITHKDCGAPVHAKLVCDEGHVVPVDQLERARTRVRACARGLEFLAGRDEFSRGRWSYGA